MKKVNVYEETNRCLLCQDAISLTRRIKLS